MYGMNSQEQAVDKDCESCDRAKACVRRWSAMPNDMDRSCWNPTGCLRVVDEKQGRLQMDCDTCGCGPKGTRESLVCWDCQSESRQDNVPPWWSPKGILRVREERKGRRPLRGAIGAELG
jgi:hypothetical protein